MVNVVSLPDVVAHSPTRCERAHTTQIPTVSIDTAIQQGRNIRICMCFFRQRGIGVKSLSVPDRWASVDNYGDMPFERQIEILEYLIIKFRPNYRI